MIKIYNSSREYITSTDEYKNFHIVKMVNVVDTIIFELDKSIGKFIGVEGYIIYGGQEYVIKEVNFIDDYEIVAQLNIEILQSPTDNTIWATHYRVSAANIIAYALGDLSMHYGGDWSVVTSRDDESIRNYTKFISSGTTILQDIEDLMREGNWEFRVDPSEQKIYIGGKLGSDKGVIFDTESNLKDVSRNTDSYDFATRLVPVGKNGLSIKSVNNGLNYVSNYDNSNKVSYRFWVDNRYTDAQNLMAVAKEKVKIIGKPMSSLRCDAIDLSNMNSSYKSFDLGDTVTIIDGNHNIAEKHRIVECTIYPNDPTRDSFIFENRPRNIFDRNEEMSKEVDNKLGAMFDDTNSKLEEINDRLDNDGDNDNDWDNDNLYTYSINVDKPSYTLTGFNVDYINEELEGIYPVDLIIPPYYNGLPVTRTFHGFDQSSLNKNRIKSIKLSNEMINIGKSTFTGVDITELIIPSNVKKIDNGAFYVCKITKLTLEEGVEYIGNVSFADNQIKELVIPSSVRHLGAGAFERNNLTNVIILDGIEHLESSTFLGNEDLTELSIPDSVVSIGHHFEIIKSEPQPRRLYANLIGDDTEDPLVIRGYEFSTGWYLAGPPKTS